MSRRLIAGLAGVVLAALATTSAFAAYPPNVSTVTASAPQTLTSDAAAAGFTISAQVMGQPAVSTAQAGDSGLPDLNVMWSSSSSAGVTVTITPDHSMTNASGVVTAKATIVCASCTVWFTATEESSGQQGSAKTIVTAAELPVTSTATTSGMSGSLPATLLAVLAIVAGAILMARQVVVSRR